MPSAGPPPGSLLNVQNLYHLQLAQAPLNQAGLHKPHPTPSLLHLTQHLEQDQQHQHQHHLGAVDQLEQQQELLGRLDDTDTGEASMPLPANTDYKHKPRRKATERPSVSFFPARLRILYSLWLAPTGICLTNASHVRNPLPSSCDLTTATIGCLGKLL